MKAKGYFFQLLCYGSQVDRVFKLTSHLGIDFGKQVMDPKAVTKATIICFTICFYIIYSVICIISLIGLTLLLIRLRLSRHSLERHKIRINGEERFFLIHVPQGLKEGTESFQVYPVLFCLHGGTGNANQFALSGGFIEASDKFGFIAIFPDGNPCNPNIPSFNCWNSGYINPERTAKTDDVLFLKTLIHHVTMSQGNASTIQYNIDAHHDFGVNQDNHYDLLEVDHKAMRKELFQNENIGIDINRVYFTGHSNGAMMSYRMAGEYSEFIAAIAPVSGTIGGRTGDDPLYVIPPPQHPISVLSVHGMKDVNVRIDGGLSTNPFHTVRYDLSQKDAINYFLEHLQCSPRNISDTGQDYRLQVTSRDGTSLIFTIYNEEASCFNSTSSKVDIMSFNVDGNHFWNDMERPISRNTDLIIPFAGISANSYNSLADFIWLIIRNYSKNIIQY